MIRAEAPSYTVAIYIAGDLETARAVCRRHCMDVGLCVTVEPVEYIYTGGSETGVRVGLINYPRFPSKPADLMAMAEALAMLLKDALCQQSLSIVAPDKTVWLSWRQDGSQDASQAPGNATNGEAVGRPDPRNPT